MDHVRRINPGYPIRAAKGRLSGCVSLIIAINSHGEPVVKSITDTFPRGVFNAKAVDAIKQWRWVTTSSNKQKMPVLSTVQLDFIVQRTKNKTAAEQHCNFDVQKITGSAEQS